MSAEQTLWRITYAEQKSKVQFTFNYIFAENHSWEASYNIIIKSYNFQEKEGSIMRTILTLTETTKLLDSLTEYM